MLEKNMLLLWSLHAIKQHGIICLIIYESSIMCVNYLSKWFSWLNECQLIWYDTMRCDACYCLSYDEVNYDRESTKFRKFIHLMIYAARTTSRKWDNRRWIFWKNVVYAMFRVSVMRGNSITMLCVYATASEIQCQSIKVVISLHHTVYANENKWRIYVVCDLNGGYRRNEWINVLQQVAKCQSKIM